MIPHSPYGTYFRQPEELPQPGEEYHLHCNGINISFFTIDMWYSNPTEQDLLHPFNKIYLQRPDLLP